MARNRMNYGWLMAMFEPPPETSNAKGKTSVGGKVTPASEPKSVGTVEQRKAILFLDFDDVICLNRPYGCYDVLVRDPPGDLWERLFHTPAVDTLLKIMEEHQPGVVITSSWLRFLPRQGIETLMRKTRLGPVADALHTAWEAPQNAASGRLQAIQLWLTANHGGEAIVILDDERSGTGLHGSKLDKAGCVILCVENVGLHEGHLPAVALAFAHAKVPTAAKKL